MNANDTWFVDRNCYGTEYHVHLIVNVDLGLSQLVVAIIGFYASLYVVGKGVSSIFSSPKSKAPPGESPISTRMWFHSNDLFAEIECALVD